MCTQVSDAGCAALAAALDNGTLPSLKTLWLYETPASTEEKVAVYEARPGLEGGFESESESEQEGSESEEGEEDED